MALCERIDKQQTCEQQMSVPYVLCLTSNTPLGVHGCQLQGRTTATEQQICSKARGVRQCVRRLGDCGASDVRLHAPEEEGEHG